MNSAGHRYSARPCPRGSSQAAGSPTIIADARRTNCFYACTYCRTHTPDHLCIITRDMPGQCGRYTWEDARRASAKEPAGMQRPVTAGRLISMARNEWTGVNAFVRADTNGTYRRVCMGSLLEFPPPLSPCCECIAVYAPEGDGVVLVNREYQGTTPLGMTFTEILSYTRGRQTPGFMGIARNALLSPDFLRAQGGLRRVVWMPRELAQWIRRISVEHGTAVSKAASSVRDTCDMSVPIGGRIVQNLPRAVGSPT